MSGEARLGRNGQATARAIAASMVVGGPLFAMWLGAVDRAFNLGLLHLQGVDASPLKGPAVLGVIVAPILVALVLWLRQPRGAKVTWNDWGVAEYDGDGVRVAIARAKMKHRLFTVKLQRRNAAPGDGAVVGGQLTFADDDGRRIDVCQGVQNVTLNRRLSTVDQLAPLAEYAKGSPAAEVKQQPVSENLTALGFFVGLIGYVMAGFGLAAIAIQPMENGLWFMPVPAGIVLLLRSLAFWRRASKNAVGDSGARPVTLVEGEGTRLNVKDGASTRWLELAPLKLPDAALATRRGPGFIRTDPTGALLGLETDAMRRARRSRLFADRLEAAARTLMALLVLAPGVVRLVPYLQRETSNVPGITTVWLDPKGNVTGLALTPSLALVSGESVMLLDARTGALKRTFPGGRCSLARAALSPDERWAAFSCDRPKAELWDLTGNASEPAARFEESSSIDTLAFTLDGRLVTASGFGHIAIHSVPDGATVTAVEASMSVQTIAVAPDGHFAFTDGRDLKLWRGDASAPVKVERGWLTRHALAFSPDGKWLAVVSGEIELLDANTGANTGKRVPTHYSGLGDIELAFSPDSQGLAVGNGDVTVSTLNDPPREVVRRELMLRRGFMRAPFQAGPMLFTAPNELSVLAHWEGTLQRVAVP